MDDLIEFLRARHAAAEEAAHLAEAVDPSPWYEDVSDGTYTRQREGLDSVGLVRAADNVGLWDRESSDALSMAGATATHIAAYDPAATLRRIAADREILALYERAQTECPADGRAYDWESDTGRARTVALEEVVRVLAAGWGWTPTA